MTQRIFCSSTCLRMLLPPSDLSVFNNMVTAIEAEAYDILKYRSGVYENYLIMIFEHHQSELFSDITNRIFSVSPKISINLTQFSRTSVGPEILCPVKYDYFTLCLITIYHLSVKLHLSYLSIVVRTPPLRSPISGRTPKRRLITPIPGQHLHC